MVVGLCCIAEHLEHLKAFRVFILIYSFLYLSLCLSLSLYLSLCLSLSLYIFLFLDCIF